MAAALSSISGHAVQVYRVPGQGAVAGSGEKRYFPPPVAGCYNHSMSVFRRRPRQPKYGPAVLQMEMTGPRRWLSTSVLVRPIARGIPRVYLSMNTPGGYGSVCFLTEDEVRKLVQALLDAIGQSKALTARESG
jgi:hypothetical protein